MLGVALVVGNGNQRIEKSMFGAYVKPLIMRVILGHSFFKCHAQCRIEPLLSLRLFKRPGLSEGKGIARIT